ncbi:PYRR, partial [Symbiodinium sp. KB8]
MVGFRTAQIDDPELTVRHVEGEQPIRIVVDPLGEVDDDSNLVRTATELPTWLLASEDVDPRRSGVLSDHGVQVIHVPTAEGPRRLHLGGGGLVAQLFAWNCVDQVLAFVAPKIIGGKTSPTPVAGDGRPFMAEAWQLRDVAFQPCEE